jgi:hypothetical protein
MTLRAGCTLAHELANGVEYHLERSVIPPLEAGSSGAPDDSPFTDGERV